MIKGEELKTKFNKYVMPTYAPAVTLIKGKGTKVWADNGMVYLDFIAGISVLNTGYSHPTVVAAIQEQAEKLIDPYFLPR